MDTPDVKKVLVTGATGYIGKHIVLQLLKAGHIVRGSTRSISREGELRNALSTHLPGSVLTTRLEVIALDLQTDEGWGDAMHGVDVLIHVASPCPAKEPKAEEDVIRPAVDGAMRAVKVAHDAGVTRIIMTSSVAAVVNADLPNDRTAWNESDWSDATKPSLSAYVKSKTLAEKAVWDWQKDQALKMSITVINPSFVLGAPLDKHYGPSIHKVKGLLQENKTTMIPRYGYSCVDVQDIALMHVRALERPNESEGKRFIGSAECFLWVHEMAQILAEAHPERSITTRQAPSWSIRFKSLYDKSLRYVATNLDRRRELCNEQSRQVLGIEFRDPRESLRETADFLVRNELV